MSDDEANTVRIIWNSECNKYLLEDWKKLNLLSANMQGTSYTSKRPRPQWIDFLNNDKPWTALDSDPSDWFNYGYSEDTFNRFANEQYTMRSNYLSGQNILDQTGDSDDRRKHK